MDTERIIFMADKRKNCWEVLQCGRESGGDKVTEQGQCPVAQHILSDGINKGKMAGRICWTVAGTYCHGAIQGSFAHKFEDCLNCSFFQMVQKEEDRAFVLLPPENIKKE